MACKAMHSKVSHQITGLSVEKKQIVRAAAAEKTTDAVSVWPVAMCGCERWTRRAADKKRIEE